MSEEDVQVKVNSKEGVFWKNARMTFEEKVKVGKVQAELDQICLDHCKKREEEDSKKVEEALKK